MAPIIPGQTSGPGKGIEGLLSWLRDLNVLQVK